MRSRFHRILPDHHRFADIRIDEKDMLARLPDGARKIQDHRTLSFIRNRAGEQDRAHVISTELKIRPKRTHGFPHGCTHRFDI